LNKIKDTRSYSERIQGHNHPFAARHRYFPGCRVRDGVRTNVPPFRPMRTVWWFFQLMRLRMVFVFVGVFCVFLLFFCSVNFRRHSKNPSATTDSPPNHKGKTRGNPHVQPKNITQPGDPFNMMKWGSDVAEKHCQISKISQQRPD